MHSAESCICKKVCAADLRILCTDGFCTFADLRICVLQKCAEDFTHANIFSQVVHRRNYFSHMCNHVIFFCAHKKHKISEFRQNRQNLEKVEISENVRKCPVGF